MQRDRSALERLRRRFILSAIVALAITLIVLLVAVSLVFFSAVTSRADSLIDTLYENDGHFPQPNEEERPAITEPFSISGETPYETRYAVLEVNEDGTVAELEVRQIVTKGSEQLENLALDIFNGNQERGYSGYYRFAVFSDDDSSGSVTIVIIDCYLTLQIGFTVLKGASLGIVVCLIMVFLLLIPLSKRGMRPFARNLERQQRFVTDASHELKTPLAIISANTDVTEQLEGETQWTRSTKKQISRLNTLIRDLIDMSRATESHHDASLPTFNLSELASRTAEDFLPLAEVAEKPLSIHIEENLWVQGNEEALQRLCNILLDNAVKYGDEQGEIRFSLQAYRRGILLRVSNPAKSLPSAEVDKLFDRFYRADSSRARSTGGYGIGLSVALGITERHGGKLQASKEGEVLSFSATLPRALPQPPQSSKPKEPKEH